MITPLYFRNGDVNQIFRAKYHKKIDFALVQADLYINQKELCLYHYEITESTLELASKYSILPIAEGNYAATIFISDVQSQAENKDVTIDGNFQGTFVYLDTKENSQKYESLVTQSLLETIKFYTQESGINENKVFVKDALIGESSLHHSEDKEFTKILIDIRVNLISLG